MGNPQQRRSTAPRIPTPPPPVPSLHLSHPFPHPPTLDLGGQSGGDEEITPDSGIKKTAGRANWNHQRMVHLIGLLKEYDVPRYRTNNAWSKEAWNGIAAKFNLKFSTTFTVLQVKQKEQDMKKEYRAVKDLSGESGFGWDSDRKMVTATDEVWESLEARRNKESLLRWRDKSYPYFDDLFALYDGRYAEGRSCHGMDHYAKKSKKSVDVGVPSPPLHVADLLVSPAPSVHVPCASLNVEFEDSGTRDETNWFGSDEFNQFSTAENNSQFLEREHALHSSDQEPHAYEQLTETLGMNSGPSTSTPQVADKKRPKRQKTICTTPTEGFHEKFLKLKKEEIDRFAAIEEKKMEKMEDPYSINNCVTALEGMADLLQIEEMIKGADIFKDNPGNRQVFLSFSSVALRLAWLRQQL